MERVVVTGLGAISPFGYGAKLLWDSLKENRNGIVRDSDNSGKDLPQIYGILPCNIDSGRSIRFYKPDSIFNYNQIFITAVEEAVNQSGLDLRAENREKIGVFVCNHIPARFTINEGKIEAVNDVFKKEYRSLKLIKALDESNLVSHIAFDGQDALNHYISSAYDMEGPQLSIGTACNSSANALEEAFFEIANNRLKAVIVGGAFEYSPLESYNFQSCGILSAGTDPDTACRPFDKLRSGMVLGSGCGILVLESYRSAIKRNAEILCEISGCCTYHNPGESLFFNAVKTIKGALKMACHSPEDINYINASGISSVFADRIETDVLVECFGHSIYSIPISSTKSMTGHTMIASGAIEAVVSAQSIKEGIIHPTRNWQYRDPDLLLDYTPHQARQLKLNHVLSNSFGLNGACSSIVFSKI